jgi:enamine deaminase RidA (YjgF/YER057c/UK114 family)
MNHIEQSLARMGLVLPTSPKPAANYSPFTQSGPLVFISGQLPLVDGKPQFIGKVGEQYDSETAQEAAKICALNLLSVLKSATNGDLSRVTRCIRLGGFINAIPNFTEHSKVMNGASDLMIEIMGENGRHARAAVGCVSLPFGVAVEVEGTFEVKL